MEKKKALPGDFLSMEEEFEPGKNAFVSKGEVRSGAAGTVSIDNKSKTIDVEPAKGLKELHRNSIVFAVVENVKDTSVLLSLLQKPEKEERQVMNLTRAMLPIRKVSRDYVEKLSEKFKVGDIVKAKVSEISPLGIDLETEDADLGVVKAFCSKCRQPLHLFGNRLRCLRCGSNETRKISKGYMLK